MVLLVGGSSFNFDGDDSSSLRKSRRSELADVFDAYSMSSPKECLKDAELITIKPGDGILYIHQSEMATAQYGLDAVSTESGGRIDTSLPRYVGTSEMTSCHAVLITSHTGFAFGHLDGSGRGRLTNAFFDEATKFFDSISSEILDVHIVGGFFDARGFSMDLSRQIITALARSGRIFRLQTLCSYSLNDCTTAKLGKELHSPVVRAVVFDTYLSAIFPAFIQPDARGPLSVLRSSYTYSISARDHMHNILNPISHRIIIKPFAFDENTLDTFSHVEHYSYEQLRNFSTTPRQETENFYEMLKCTGRLLSSLKKEKVDIFAGENLEFFFDATMNQWCPATPQTRKALEYPFTCYEWR